MNAKDAEIEARDLCFLEARWRCVLVGTGTNFIFVLKTFIVSTDLESSVVVWSLETYL